MDQLFSLLIMAVGCLVTALVFALVSRRASVRRAEFAQNELDSIRETLGSLKARAERTEKLEAELAAVTASHNTLEVENRALEEQLKFQSSRYEEQAALLAEARTELRKAFAQASLEALSASGQQFLTLANEVLDKKLESARGDLEARKESFEVVGTQIRQALEQVTSKIDILEQGRREAYGDLTRFLKSVAESTERVGQEAHRLHHALTGTRAQGRWGEMQLRNAVEAAGMLEYCDFLEQQEISDQAGRARPDLVVRLPNSRCVIVDAKAPLNAFLEGIEATETAVRSRKLRDHAHAIKDHIRDLAQREYPSRWPGALEYTLLFLPGESFFYAALEEEGALMNHAAEYKVVIVTPISLIAFLRAAALGWREVTLQKNAEDIRKLGTELYDRLYRFSDVFGKVGRLLSSTVREYNRAVGSFDRRLLVTARRFQELGATSGSEVPVPTLIVEQAHVTNTHATNDGVADDEAAEGENGQEADLVATSEFGALGVDGKEGISF